MMMVKVTKQAPYTTILYNQVRSMQVTRKIRMNIRKPIVPFLVDPKVPALESTMQVCKSCLTTKNPGALSITEKTVLVDVASDAALTPYLVGNERSGARLLC